MNTKKVKKAGGLSIFAPRVRTAVTMGRQWISALGLGTFHKESSAFHCFCREQDVEGRVKAGVANGFVLQCEMEQAFAAQKEADTLKGEASGKRGKRKAAGTAASEGAPPLKIKKAAAGAKGGAGESEEVDCNTLAGLKKWRSFKEACCHYEFPGSHQVIWHDGPHLHVARSLLMCSCFQVGSYGPKGGGMVRTYSNSTPGKDKVLADGNVMLYRLKDENCRAQFTVNIRQRKAVRVFRKVAAGVLELGAFLVEGFEKAGGMDQPAKFGAEFVRFARVGNDTS